MSYSESKIRVVLVSPNLEEIKYVSEEVRSNLDKKGGEYSGPAALPIVDPSDLAEFLAHIQNPSSENTNDQDHFQDWLFDIANSEKNREILIEAVKNELSLHVRVYQIYGNQMIESALKFELPNSVYAVANLGKVTRKKGMGQDPYGWDPSVDHIV